MINLRFRLLSLFILLVFFFSSSIAPVLASVSYTYDANGNMTSDGTKCYVYNQANQLKQVKDCSSNQLIAEYVYDYNGERIIKKDYVNGVLSQTVYSPDDGYQVVKQASGGATANTTFYQANGEIVAQKNPDGTITYNNTDHLGSNSVITDSAGALVEKTTYAPFGEVMSGGTTAKFQYTGQEKDQETGLNYYDARYYDPHLQRFTQPDTYTQNVYNPQDLNEYSYVLNNPVRYTDPTGHFIQILIILAAYAEIDAADPNTQLDMMGVSDAYSDLKKNNSFENRVGLGIAVALAATPDTPAISKEVRQQASKQIVKNTEKAIEKFQSTGRFIAQNLKEKLAMAQIKADPSQGKVLKNIVMNDSRWLAKDGWIKKEAKVNGVTIHWNFNTKTGKTADFKFK